MTARVAFPATTGFEPDTRRAFFERASGEIQALPGIVAAAASSGVPLAGLNFSTEVQTPAARPPAGGQPAPAGSGDARLFRGDGYSPPRRRLLLARSASEALTIIISESLAREYWPNRDPIGQPICPRLVRKPHVDDHRSRGRRTAGRPRQRAEADGLLLRRRAGRSRAIEHRVAQRRGSRIACHRRACHRATHRSGDGALRRRGQSRSRRRFARAAPVQYVPAGDLCGRRARPLPRSGSSASPPTSSRSERARLACGLPSAPTGATSSVWSSDAG